MKRYLLFLIATLISVNLSAKSNPQLQSLQSEFTKAVPAGFKIDESGTDKKNLYLVFKKTPQEVITINLQSKYEIEFEDVDTFTHKNYKMTFYYAGYEKSAGLVVFLKDKHLVIGYNKPYMGDEIVKKEELISIIDKVKIENIQ